MNPLLPPAEIDAAAVVRASRSSFLPAFRLLPRERRRDLEIFYAFCRLADDLADAGDYPTPMRYEALEAWRNGFRDPTRAGLPANLRELIERRQLPVTLFLELLDGTATDLVSPVRMPTRADLDLYCHRVAGTVGCLCLPIFGADPTRAGVYAETLGRALQYTNILRDSASDWQRDRLYYPLDELATAGLDAESWPRETARRDDYLRGFAAKAAALFEQATRESPTDDHAALRPARIMAAIYQRLLVRMQRDGLQVMERRYRLSRWEKFCTVLRAAW